MSNNFIAKLYHHKKLDFEDIKEFCIEQAKTLELGEYVNDIKLKRVLGFFEYCSYNKEIYINNDYRYSYRHTFKHFKKRIFKPYIIDTFLRPDTDLFNLYVIYASFHELCHAKQEKEINENKDSDYSILLESSLINRKFSGSVYEYYHNRYFLEYDAIINSISMSLNFIKPFNLNKKSLVAINKYFANEILVSFGIDESHPFGDKYESPIEFFHYFFDNKFYRNSEKIPDTINKLITFLQNYQLSTNEFENLISGYKISTNLIEKLKDIRDGRVNITNIIDEINSELDNHKHL